MTKLHQLVERGQSIWYDNICRAMLDNGELQALIEAGVVGVTSNPTIFEKAIAGTNDYDAAIMQMTAEGKSVDEIYEALTLADIQRTADLLRPVYEQMQSLDGYVSLEVSPQLAHDTAGTIAESRRLFAALDRPNVMIKVPATPAGVTAIEELIAEGININVTLIFGLAHYEAVAEVYMRGLERRIDGDLPVNRIASVASQRSMMLWPKWIIKTYKEPSGLPTPRTLITTSAVSLAAPAGDSWQSGAQGYSVRFGPARGRRIRPTRMPSISIN